MGRELPKQLCLQVDQYARLQSGYACAANGKYLSMTRISLVCISLPGTLCA